MGKIGGGGIRAYFCQKWGGFGNTFFVLLTEAYKQFSMKFGHLILRKIIKFVATRCQILRLKCTKIDFGWASAPDPAGGAYSAPQTLDLD